jgi:hypothetical protein
MNQPEVQGHDLHIEGNGRDAILNESLQPQRGLVRIARERPEAVEAAALFLDAHDDAGCAPVQKGYDIVEQPGLGLRLVDVHLTLEIEFLPFLQAALGELRDRERSRTRRRRSGLDGSVTLILTIAQRLS